MAEYRMAIAASVMFTVEAASEAEAIAKANKIVDDNRDGLDVDLFGKCQDGRVYVRERDDPDYVIPSVEDIYEGD